MQTEIIDTSHPCTECGSMRRAYLRDEGMSDDGTRFVAYRSEVIPHSRDACERMKTLSREQWPTLW
jgi:hypothetical protein